MTSVKPADLSSERGSELADADQDSLPNDTGSAVRGHTAKGSGSPSDQSGGGPGIDDEVSDVGDPETCADAAAEPTIQELLDSARAEAAANLDKFVRARAELDNVQKRHARERTERAKYASEGIARDLLAVIDDLERAVEHASEAEGGLAEGVSLVLKALVTSLATHGVTRIQAVGQPFDPNAHEAIAMVESADVAPDHVIEEHRAGYMLKDRLLRPAMVVVAKAPQ